MVGRGAGTGLSGGAIARSGGIVIAFSRMNRILEIDAANLRAVVQPGVVNLDLIARRRAPGPLFCARPFQPEILHHRRKRFRKFRRPAHAGLWRDDESRTGLELVLPDGEIVRIGGKTSRLPDTTWPACSSAPKERSRWSPKSPCG